MSTVRALTRDALEAGRACGCAKTAATCARLLKVEPALWTFVRVEGLEPTNNAAERAVRHAVQWRKTSYGTDSPAGGRFVARILSVVATCRQQHRHVLGYLTQCCTNALNGAPRLHFWSRLPELRPSDQVVNGYHRCSRSRRRKLRRDNHRPDARRRRVNR
jgi:hypothetical protein